MVQQGLDLLAEIGGVGLVDLGGDLQLHAQPLGDGDGAVGALLGRDAAEEGEVIARRAVEGVEFGGHAMQHRAGPVGPGQGLALVVRDRHQRELRPAAVGVRQPLQVQPPVQGGEGLAGRVLEEGELDHVGVEVDDVELIGPPADLVQHGHVRGEVGLQRRGVQPDGLVADGGQFGLGAGVGAGEQGDIVAEIDQGVAEVRHHPFGAAVVPGRDRFV